MKDLMGEFVFEQSASSTASDAGFEYLGGFESSKEEARRTSDEAII